MLAFSEVKGAGPRAGMVLKVPGRPVRYFRVTHDFATCVYGMWIREAEGARFARRPLRMDLADLRKLEKRPKACWGRVALPAAMASELRADSDEGRDLDAAWELIEPLTVAMTKEANLSSSNFTLLIRSRAELTGASFTTLRRLLLRYYYFGGTRKGLLKLPPGVSPGTGYGDVAEANAVRPPRRRGPKSVLEAEQGENTFVVSAADIEDMITLHSARLRKGPTTLTKSHELYLAGPFRKRHPKVYADYIEGKHPEPVTVRQMRSYFNLRVTLTKDLARNSRTRDRTPGNLRSLRAVGPAEVYEIDATGGRWFLVTGDDPPVHVGKPIIYVVIDRWSRFIPAVYIGLRSASYEEVRHVLLISFTSRRRRFARLKVDVDDKRWPRGRMPAVLCPDRGSELMSESMEQSVAMDLRIDLTPLPPLTPDGKAIVERFIRELKRRMADSGTPGIYADRPLNPRTKKAAKAAESAAVKTLAEAYRVLIEIVIDHNNSPHSALRRIKALTQAGVQPIPQAAYLWGLKTLTGLRVPPLTDEDYQRMLLASDTASIAKGVVTYKGRAYEPVNEVARDIARRSSRRAKPIGVRVDRTAPDELYLPNDQGEWAQFQMTEGGAAELAGLTLDEEEALSERNNLLYARAKSSRTRSRVAVAAEPRKRPGKRQEAVKVDGETTRKLRSQETRQVKDSLTGRSTPASDPPDTGRKSQLPAWQQIEEEERLKALEIIRKKGRVKA